MKKTCYLPVMLLIASCASTQPAQDTAELASQQLLRLETQLQAAADILYARYERQQEFIEQNLNAAVEAEGYTDGLKREWVVSGNTEANRLYASLLSTRKQEITLPAIARADNLTVSTAALKQAIKDLGAVSQTLSDRSTAEAFLRFGHEVQQDYKNLVDDDRQ